MKLEELEIYQLSMQISNDIWEIVIKWEYFEKNGIGKQLTNASDSISANISEGYGRLSPKDNRKFCLIARGSLYETTTWLMKAKDRNLISDDVADSFLKKLNDLKVKLWNYIQALNRRISE